MSNTRNTALSRRIAPVHFTQFEKTVCNISQLAKNPRILANKFDETWMKPMHLLTSRREPVLSDAGPERKEPASFFRP